MCAEQLDQLIELSTKWLVLLVKKWADEVNLYVGLPKTAKVRTKSSLLYFMMRVTLILRGEERKMIDGYSCKV